MTDDTVLEEHYENPALVQFRILGDGGNLTLVSVGGVNVVAASAVDVNVENGVGGVLREPGPGPVQDPWRRR